MPRTDRISKVKLRNFVDIYNKKACNVSATCKVIGCSRTMFYEWRKKYIYFDTWLMEAEESLIDTAETIVFKKLMEGDLKAATIFLNAHARHRGYGAINNIVAINHNKQINNYTHLTDKELDIQIEESATKKRKK